MKLVVHTFLTLDGIMQGPGGAEEDPSGGFGRGGWLVPFSDADMGTIAESWFARTEAILLGRNTYETMRAYWSQVTDPANQAAAKLNHGRKYVVSNTLTRADWGDTTILRGDVISQVADLRNGGRGELQVHGSARLAQALHAAGLVDEYRLLVFPVTVGAGKRLFNDDAPPRGYTLLESRSTRAGAVYQVLAPQAFEAGGLTVRDGREAVRLYTGGRTMGAIRVHEFISLDSVIDTPSWTFEFGFDPRMGEALARVTTASDGILLGRTTYEMFEPAWSKRTAEQDPGAPFFNDTTKYVVSSTLTTPTWRNSEIIGAYDAKRIQQLKEESGAGLYVSGSGTLVRALIADGLVDELHLFVYPVTRGAGPRLFDESLPAARWTRADAALYDNGVTYLKLTPAS